jgi:hypothetical protein
MCVCVCDVPARTKGSGWRIFVISLLQADYIGSKFSKRTRFTKINWYKMHTNAGKPVLNLLLERSKHRWDDNTEIQFKE